jgi:hypothetical protein
MPFGSAGYFEQLLSLHKEMHRSRQQQAHRLRQSVKLVVVARTRPDDEPGGVLVDLVKHEGPRDDKVSFGGGPGQHEPVRRFVFHENETVAAPRQRGKDGTDGWVLQALHDPVGTAAPTIVQDIVAIPAGAIRAHLNDPGPELPTVAMHGDCVRQTAGGMANHLVAWQRQQMLACGCPCPV